MFQCFKLCLGLCLFLCSAPSSEKANRKKDSVRWKEKRRAERQDRLKIFLLWLCSSRGDTRYRRLCKHIACFLWKPENTTWFCLCLETTANIILRLSLQMLCVSLLPHRDGSESCSKGGDLRNQRTVGTEDVQKPLVDITLARESWECWSMEERHKIRGHQTKFIAIGKSI